ncbi:hypothetical protein [Novosphingobium sp.]|uniref:hypothetical protein n=1 Tax=Novosphingobium sp. TaxID=1874826 RepID=UPI0026031A41|nr:hypothetical protein [Novosphingobium sp.]
MNSLFVFEYEFSRDGDDVGWLIAKVQTPSFSGSNGTWVQWQDVRDFASSLSTYPINADRPAHCEWGFSEQGQYTAITKLSIAPKGATGGLVASVLLANHYVPDNRCSTFFETDYPSVSEFSEQIKRMLNNRTGGATLTGNVEVR